MTHDERIERIARAMCVSDLERLFDEDEIAERIERAVGDYRRIARVAYRATLEAIREPTAGMCDACDAADAETGYRARPVPLWQAMIDHLLNAKPSVEDERIAVLENK